MYDSPKNQYILFRVKYKSEHRHKAIIHCYNNLKPNFAQTDFNYSTNNMKYYVPSNFIMFTYLYEPA